MFNTKETLGNHFGNHWIPFFVAINVVCGRICVNLVFDLIDKGEFLDN